ncbi:MAG: hypothetical protein H0V54_07025 [Chthoniobacterales bacterium]|nr:hypothetical protein [Chthoniobacterales bacterium]
MNWKAFHFFNEGGLSKQDTLEMCVCLDYEQALESKRIVQLLPEINPSEKAWMVGGALKVRSRFTPVRATTYDRKMGDEWAFAPFTDFDEASSFPPVPAVCAAADWFPKHWLEGTLTERSRVLEQVKSLYPISRLPVFSFPMDRDEIELLVKSLAERETLHVIAIDRTLPKSALVEKFKAWVNRQGDIDGSNSRRGKINIPARLDDLACYRLCRIDYAARLYTMDTVGFSRSEAKMSYAKARAGKRLRELGYI